MTHTRRRSLGLAAVVFSFVLTGAVLSLPAPAAHAATYDWFYLENANLGMCVAEDGTTSAVYGQTCATTNDSVQWRWTSGGEILNKHSGECLSVDGNDPGVYAGACTNNHAQEWSTTFDFSSSISTACLVINNHTNETLELEKNGALIQDYVAAYASDWYIPLPPASSDPSGDLECGE